MSGAVDPVILARVREAQAAIRRSLSVAEELLRDEGFEPGTGDEQGRVLFEELQRRHPSELLPKPELKP